MSRVPHLNAVHCTERSEVVFFCAPYPTGSYSIRRSSERWGDPFKRPACCARRLLEQYTGQRAPRLSQQQRSRQPQQRSGFSCVSRVPHFNPTADGGLRFSRTTSTRGRQTRTCFQKHDPATAWHCGAVSLNGADPSRLHAPRRVRHIQKSGAARARPRSALFFMAQRYPFVSPTRAPGACTSNRGHRQEKPCVIFFLSFRHRFFLVVARRGNLGSS